MTATHERSGPQPSAAIVRDEVLTLGPDGQLVGIVSRPLTPVPAGAPAPAHAFLVLNAGVLHRVGPHRLHVALARRLAAAGMPGMRLDLGGIGDSVMSGEAATFRDSAVADTRAAMTGLTQALGARRFVVFGVCAGADNAQAAALVDDRVAGVVLVDPHVYATQPSKLRHLRTRLGELGGPREVARWAVGVIERRVRLTLARRRARGEPPPIETMRRELTALVDRGVRVLAVYTGIHEARYNHADQVFEMFPALRGRIDRVYFPNANHTFTELSEQAALVDAVVAWMTDSKRFG